MFSFVKSTTVAGIDITIRHVTVFTDLPVVKALFTSAFTNKVVHPILTEGYLRSVYTEIALSPNANAYLVWTGELCLLLFEVHEACYYDIPLALEVSEGDWMVNLFIERRSLTENVLYIGALQACIAQCFRQPNVKRLIVESHFGKEYKWTNELLEAAHFTLWKVGSLNAGKEIYRLSRETPPRFAEER